MKHLFKALVAAQAEAKDAPLDGHNSHSNYDYTKAVTMAKVGKALLNKHGLCLLPTGLKVRPGVAAPNGAIPIDVVRGFVLGHVSGESAEFVVEWPVYLQGGKRSRDKGVAATDTTLMGYVYRDLLMVGKMAEGEVDGRDDSNGTGADTASGAGDPVRSRGRKAGSGGGKPPLREVADKPRGKAPVKAKGEEAGPKAERSPKEAKGTVDVPASARVQGQVESHDPESIDRDVLTALMLGVTPSNTKTTPISLVPHLPTDPGADDLEGVGWERSLAVQLTTLVDDQPVARKTVNSLTRLARKAMVLKANEAKHLFSQAFRSVGVDVAEGQTPNGYQLRLWAERVLRINADAVAAS